MDILYMWSDMDSGNATPERTHPVRLVVFNCPTSRKKDKRSSAVFDSGADDASADAISDRSSDVSQLSPMWVRPRPYRSVSGIADEHESRRLTILFLSKLVDKFQLFR